MAQSAPTREVVAAVGRLDADGFGVSDTGPALPVGVADVVFVLPHADTASANPTASTAQAIGAARKECSRMGNVLTHDWHALAQRRGTVP
jgi:hypothetical protein